MRYIKGTFIIVPNKQCLLGLSATTQALFMWLCSFADEKGQCYPARTTLAKIMNLKDIKTLDNHISKLVENKLIRKTGRIKNNTRITNLYQILIVEEHNEGGRVEKPPQVGGKTTHRTQSTELNTTIVAKATKEKLLVNSKTMEERYVACDAEGNEGTLSPKGKFRAKHTTAFSWDKQVDEMKNSPIAVHRTIILYWLTKGWKFDNWGQYDKALLREVRPAKELNDYDLAEIKKGIKYCKEKFEDKWTLETVAKWMPEALKVKKEILL